MINDFFKEIAVPKFLKGYFEHDDWFKVVGKLKEIIQNSGVEFVQLSSGKNLICNGQVYIGKDCAIGDNVVIDGPSYIGNGVELTTGCYIRAGSVISNECSVGHAAEIKNSIMMEKSKVSNHAFLGDSILGKSGRLAGHSETGNRRFDQAIIELSYKEKRISTGLDKFGAIIGQGSRLGGGVTIFPGTAIGMNSFISAGVIIGGFIAPNQFVNLDLNYKIRDNNFTGELHSKSKIYE